MKNFHWFFVYILLTLSLLPYRTQTYRMMFSKLFLEATVCQDEMKGDFVRNIKAAFLIKTL